ncbi:lysM and putative peptidoglycan-binding domain-containing protein 1 [Gouania willdenowi]|uniref:LysM and putative peptidoglycan-binding domain-containing protein 1 n=1 Tax=Gouania willdenowi TaxID=441366 RepID=A0A8C5NB60_GOUWI|nr:lysM and putative peptidoglycan-binding domain-containing protein 1 [Gouania willdenowi]XP_028326209.1 lysM and putative peptidoglycan-binding domain-containing protein 1 [Gouania willdenowi]
MSGERAPLPVGFKGFLRGERSKSYGSLLVQSPTRYVDHTIQPGETLQGLSLKYGVSMEEIKRANRLYTNDSIFLKKSLLIPALSDLGGCSNGGDLAKENGDEARASFHRGQAGSFFEKSREELTEEASTDLTPVDFLKRLDDVINQSKQAAVKGCQDAEKRVAALEAKCTTSAERRPFTRSQSCVSPSTTEQQQTAHRAVPLTVTRLTMKLRDQEDEIFEL